MAISKNSHLLNALVNLVPRGKDFLPPEGSISRSASLRVDLRNTNILRKSTFTKLPQHHQAILVPTKGRVNSNIANMGIGKALAKEY